MPLHCSQFPDVDKSGVGAKEITSDNRLTLCISVRNVVSLIGKLGYLDQSSQCHLVLLLLYP